MLIPSILMVLPQYQDYRKSIHVEDKRRCRPAKLKLKLEQNVRALQAEDEQFTVGIIPAQLRVSEIYINRNLMEDKHKGKISATLLVTSTPL